MFTRLNNLPYRYSIFWRVSKTLVWASWLLALQTTNHAAASFAVPISLIPSNYCTLPLCLSWSSGESDQTWGVAWGDYDGDGDLDLAVGNYAQPKRLYRNDAGVLTTNAVWSSTESDYTWSVAWGDYDGDGDLDLAAGNEGQPNRLYRNDLGTLTASTVWTPTVSDPTHSVAWGDYDGDGDLDLVVGNDGRPNRLYRNDLGILTTSTVWTATVSDPTRSVAWGDYDGDGDLDLAVGNAGQPNRLYRNDLGTLTISATWASAQSNLTTSVAWGDYDNDGDLDLVVGNYSQPNQLYRNEAGLLTTAPVWVSGESDNTWSVAWGDYDGDGDLDLAAGNGTTSNGQVNRVYRNDAGLLTASAVWASAESDSTFGVVWGDYDNDGDLDLAAGNYGQSNRLYRNEAGVLATSAGWATAGIVPITSAAWGDYDGDGDLDLALGRGSFPANGATRLYRNDAGLLTVSAVWTSTETASTRSVAWGDYDGDGDLDLAAGNYGQPNRLYRNDAGLLTVSAVWTSAETASTRSVAWGDYDGDGDLDLLAGNEGQANRLYRNDAGQLTLSAVWASTESDATTSVAWGDYDGDGDLDLAVGNSVQPNRLYHNENGQLTLSAVWSATEDDTTTSVAWGDYDGDGDLDLVVGNSGQPNRLYRNDAGQLTPSAVWTSTESDATTSVAWGDYDGDGDLDLAVGNYAQPNRLYRNNTGLLAPSAVWSSAESDTTTSVAWGDYDGDGDLDLVVGNYVHSSQLYRNNRDGRALPGVISLIRLTRPVIDADSYSTPHILSGTLSLPYSLYDTQGDPVRVVRAWYSPDGGGRWLPAVAATGTVTQNLSTTNFFTRTFALTPALAIPTVGILTATTALTAVQYANEYIADIDVWVNLSHANVSDLIITLTNPVSQAITLVNRQGGVNANFTNTVFDDEAASSIVTGTAPFASRYRPEQALTHFDGKPLMGIWKLTLQDVVSPTGGVFNAWGLTITLNSGRIYTYYWDVNASGFFGQSDNVVFRLAAVPSLTHTHNALAGPYLYGSYASNTFPFRVRGSQIRVLSGTEPISNAIVYQLPATQTLGALPIQALNGVAFRTDNQGYLQGRGALTVGDRLVALYPLTTTPAYTVYATSATPTLNGLAMYTVTNTGIQTLTALAANPLIVFNLDVSLEWDARNDLEYLTQLQFDFKRASEILFDASNGQVVLGEVNIYHARGDMYPVDVRIRATNALRPYARLGGVVLTPTVEYPLFITQPITYTMGPVVLGATWNRYGDLGLRLGEDYARTLAHELSHWMLFVDDDYLGLDAQGHLQLVSTCTGTLMSDPYLDANSEFHPDTDWVSKCANTLAHQITGRSDWATLKKFYPWLNTPTVPITQVNLGPSSLPLALTQVQFIDPITPTATLPDARFYLKDNGGASVIPGANAQIVLSRNGQLIDLGRPMVDQAVARGAQPGDWLCVYDTAGGRVGCKSVTSNDNQELHLATVTNWQPDARLSLPNSRTVNVQVQNLPAGLTLSATLYSEVGGSSQAMTYANGLYSATLTTLGLTAGTGQVVVQVMSDPNPTTRRQLLTTYAIGGNLEINRGPSKWDGNAGRWNHNAPVFSNDGHFIIYAANLNFPYHSYYVVQEATLLPSVPSWATPVGKGYWLTTSPTAPNPAQAAISLSYAQQDVPAGAESWLKLYHWNGTIWTPLTTTVDVGDNQAVAAATGPGLYGLFATIEVPLYGPGWDVFDYPVAATQTITTALQSITGTYTTVYWLDRSDPDPWKVYDSSMPGYAIDLHHLQLGEGYWISMTQNAILRFNGAPGAGQLFNTDAPTAETGKSALEGFPAPPATYYGRVTGLFAPGQLVVAYIHNTPCGQGQTQLVNGQLVYSLNVFGQSPTFASCGMMGQTVRFRINGQGMFTTALWQNNRPAQLDLLPGWFTWLPWMGK